MLVGEAATRVRDLIRELFGTLDVKIMKGHVSKDHVHLLVSIPPQVAINKLMQRLKEREDGIQGDDGDSASEEALLGTTHVGVRVLLLQHGERHRRDHR